MLRRLRGRRGWNGRGGNRKWLFCKAIERDKVGWRGGVSSINERTGMNEDEERQAFKEWWEPVEWDWRGSRELRPREAAWLAWLERSRRES